MDTQNLVKRVSEYMKQHHMAEAGDGILAAVSGGADSVCLLLVLEELASELGIRLAAFHMNHGIRGDEADRDEAYVRALCEAHGIALKVVREDVPQYARKEKVSEEEAGRILRYCHLEQAAKELNCRKIAVAHHRDDNAETVLMNLFRGTGLKGLGGIRPVRGTIIRPLLQLTRAEIESYLYKKKADWCEDSTNMESDYGRNRVRNVLLPWVCENINERAVDHVLKTAEFAAEADVYFAEQAEKILEECAVYKEAEEPARDVKIQSVKIPVCVFDAQPTILKPYLLKKMIGVLNVGEKDIAVRHLDAIRTLRGPGGGTQVDLPGGLQAVRSYDTLEIQRSEAVKPAKCKEISVEMRTFPWKKEMEISKNQYTKWFDYDKIENTLSVRTRETGDYLMIAGEKRKLLKRFFIDEKIPEAMRGEIPLLADGNHILWVIGHRISEFYKVSDSTRTVLEVRIYKGEKNDREN